MALLTHHTHLIHIPSAASGNRRVLGLPIPRDFNVRSLVGNAVLRWEYLPGSTIFFVWQRRQAGTVSLGDFDFDRYLDALLSAPSDDQFMVKVDYWLGM